MVRRARPLTSLDRTEFDPKPLGLQRHGRHNFDRRLFVVIFFTRKAASRRPLQASRPPLTHYWSEWRERISLDDPLGPLGRLLGYIIAIAAVGILVYAVSPPVRPLLQNGTARIQTTY